MSRQEVSGVEALSHDVAQCDRANLRCQRKRIGASVNHVERIQTEVDERDSHRRRDRWSGGQLDLEAEPFPSTHDEQVELRPLVRRPEETAVARYSQRPDARFDAKAFPGCS